VRQQKLGARAGMLPHRKQSISLPLQRICVQKSANTYIKLLSLSRVNKKLFQTRESAIHLKKKQLKSRLNKPDSPKPTQIRRDFISSKEKKSKKKNTASNLPRIQKRNFTIIYDKNYGTIIQTTEVNNTVESTLRLKKKKRLQPKYRAYS